MSVPQQPTWHPQQPGQTVLMSPPPPLQHFLIQSLRMPPPPQSNNLTSCYATTFELKECKSYGVMFLAPIS
ncbi:hypothetical protein VNO80_22819 [Phaseolus coccineus]|uniref:Uncharacterized protein n=1 Tax=Phaseolus coccineus TaxID=3886 RepID=A0AAN9MAK2_PHACN